ncbi:MAG: sugar transferase [Flavobacteriales bacterium]
MKRIFDLFFAIMGLIICSPLFLILIIIIPFDGNGGAFFIQKRVGKGNVDFDLYKFRTMKKDADKAGKLTKSDSDPRITSIGAVLRKLKLDELPQFINIVKGDMSFVGPRPEVRRYVDTYDEEQKKVLTVKPGITDPASLAYIKENEILGKANDPEKEYIENIMPQKLKMNLEYIENRGFGRDMKIIATTIGKVLKAFYS